MKKRKENRAVQVNITIIGGDCVLGDKAGGDIVGRDILKAGGNITINQNQIRELKDIITEPRKVHGRPELPKDKKEELEAEVQTIESQSKSPKPKIQIIKCALSSARKIIEQALGVVTAVAFIIAKLVLG